MRFRDINLKEMFNYEDLFNGFNFNDYLDHCMHKLRVLLTRKFEPMELEPMQTSFEYEAWFFKFTADLEMENTRLMNLTKVQRYGTPVAFYEDKHFQIRWQMIFPELEMQSSYLLKWARNAKHGTLRAKVNDLVADVEFRYEIEHLKTKLHTLKLHTNKTIDVELGSDTGEEIDKISSAFLKAVSNLFKGKILTSVENAVREQIEEILEGNQINI